MISEETLERLLGEAGSAYDVPVDGPATVLRSAPSAGGPSRRRPIRHRRLAWGAAAATVALVGALAGAVASGGSAGHEGQVATAPGLAEHAASNGGSSAQSLAASPPSAGASGGTGTAAGGTSAGAGSGAASAPQVAGQPGQTPAGGPRIVKTGRVDLRVGKGQVGPVMTKLSALAGQAGGYVATSTSQLGGDEPSGMVRLRVPADAFDGTVGKAAALGHVLSETKSGKDVTAQYVDNAARLDALEATRSSFLTLLSRANTIGDTLAVQQQITAVQQQIEQLQGQQKLLADQSDFATLDVTVVQRTPKAATTAGRGPSDLHKAFSSAADGFTDGLESLIAVSGSALLAVLVFAAVVAVLRFGYRLLRRRGV